MISLERALEVFVHGYCAGRSRTWPYLGSQHGHVWVLQDAEGRKEKRKTEVVTKSAPNQAVAQIQQLNLGWHFIADIAEDENDIESRKRAYSELGYRKISTEWMYAHGMRNLPAFASTPAPQFIESQDALANVPSYSGDKNRWRSEADQFVVWDGAIRIGEVSSVAVGEDAWISNLYVQDEYRSRGFGKALMSAVLHHDAARGIRNSVLLATKAGSRIYPSLGYQLIGLMQIFCPRDRAKYGVSR